MKAGQPRRRPASCISAIPSMDRGGVGAGEGEWLRAYGRAAAMVPRVEKLAAGRARLEAVNGMQHEFWEARDVILQCRLLQADESRRRWEAAYMALQHSSGDDRRFPELQNSDLEDLQTFVDLLDAENTEFKVQMREVEGGAEHCQIAADHEHIAGELKAALRQLKQTYEALCSEKDKEVSALITEKDKEVSALIAEKDKEVSAVLTEKDKEVSAVLTEKDKEVSALITEKDKEISAIIAEKDFVREQFRTLQRDNADLSSYSNKQAAQVTEAKQELEQLQVASQKKDDEIRRLRARAKAAEAKRKLVPPEGKAQEMYCMPKEKDGQVEKRKDRQPETSQKCKKHMCETHNKNCSEGPASKQEETKKYSSKQVLAKDGQRQTVQKRKCVTFLSNDNEQNANDEETTSQVLEPLKKKREVEQDDSKAKLANSKSNGDLVRQLPVGEVEAKRNSVPEDNLQAMYCMPKETDGQIEKCKDRQPETCQKTKKVSPSCSRADFMQSQQSSSHFVQSANNLTQCTDEGGSNFREVANAKDQLIPIVKKSIKHVCARSPLDQSSFTDVARQATHTILALSGIAHNRDRVVATPFPFPSHCCHACDGREPAFLMGTICSSCFNSFVRDVVSHIANMFS